MFQDPFTVLHTSIAELTVNEPPGLSCVCLEFDWFANQCSSSGVVFSSFPLLSILSNFSSIVNSIQLHPFIYYFPRVLHLSSLSGL